MTFDTLVNKLEKAVKTDIRYALHGGFWLVSGQAVSIVAYFALAIAFAHFLPKETYGSYKYVLSIAGMLGALTLSGAGSAITQSVARGFDGIVHRMFWKNIKWGTVLFAAACAGSVYYAWNGNYFLAGSLLLIGIFVPFTVSFSYFDPYLIGKKDFKKESIYSLIDTLIPIACLLVSLVLRLPLFAILVVYFASNLVAAGLFYKITLKKYPPHTSYDPRSLSYGTHLSVINILSIIADNIGQVLIFHYLGPIQLAVYSFATAIPEQLKGLLKNMATLTLPKFSERSHAEIKSDIWRKMGLFALLIAVMVGAYILFAPLIFKLMFPKYVDAVFYSQILSLSLLTAVSILPYSFLQSKMASRLLYVYNTTTSISMIIFLFVGIYYFSILGAIVATIVNRLFGLVLIAIITIFFKEKKPAA